MNTRMPIARRLVLGEFKISSESEEKNPKAFFRDATLVDAQIACDLLGTSDLPNPETFGPLTPGFDSMWFEWSCGTTSDPKMTNFAASVVSFPHLKSQFSIIIYIRNPNGKLVMLPASLTVNTDEQGIFTSATTHQNVDDPNWNEQGNEYLRGEATVALMTLGLMNCKNVSTKTSGSVNLPRSGTEKRRGIPARKIKYHTIMLPGGGSQSDGRGGHRATAIHRVRGHFKTFTAEKPLLGQHVGTYWWGWQVRGKAENGIVVSDYKVGVQ